MLLLCFCSHISCFCSAFLLILLWEKPRNHKQDGKESWFLTPTKLLVAGCCSTSVHKIPLWAHPLFICCWSVPAGFILLLWLQSWVWGCGEDALWLQSCVGKDTFRGEQSAYRPGMLLSPCFHPLFILAGSGSKRQWMRAAHCIRISGHQVSGITAGFCMLSPWVSEGFPGETKWVKNNFQPKVSEIDSVCLRSKSSWLVGNASAEWCAVLCYSVAQTSAFRWLSC